MRRLLLPALLAISLAGSMYAQQATGERAEEAKKVVMQFEKDKVPLLLKGGPDFADYFDRVDADDVVIIHGDGSTVSKATQIGARESESRSPTTSTIITFTSTMAETS